MHIIITSYRELVNLRNKLNETKGSKDIQCDI